MIPLSVPNLQGNEWKYIKECLDTNWVSSVGSYVNLFEQKVAEYCDMKYAVATSNGTAALHISLLLAGVQRNDLVVLPNITFVAPANAIKYIGSDPVLIDVDEQTWQIDLGLLEHFLYTETEVNENGCIHFSSGRRIAALLPVHVLGNMCEMDRLLELCNRYNIPVIEDATESLGSLYKNKNAGGFGIFGCLSFNGNKIITTGGGGMILTNDESLAKHAKHLTTQAKAEPTEYYHDEIGYNYRLVNILAAMGVAQMEQLPGFLKRKQQVSQMYTDAFQHIAGFRQQVVTEGVTPNNWLYTAKFPKQKELRAFLWNNGLEVRPFWVPMNQLPKFNRDIYIHGHDRSDAVYRNCLSLPCSTGITDDEINKVIELVRSFYNG